MDNLLTPSEAENEALLGEEIYENQVDRGWTGRDKIKAGLFRVCQTQDKKTAEAYRSINAKAIAAAQTLFQSEQAKLRTLHNEEMEGQAKRLFGKLDEPCPHWKFPTDREPKRSCHVCIEELKKEFIH